MTPPPVSPAPDSFAAPPFALKAGLVGNRRFETGDSAQGATMAAQAATACDAIWEQIVKTMEEIRRTPLPAPARAESRHGPPAPASVSAQERTLANFFAPGAAYLSVLTGLAAGVDQIGARSALSLGKTHPDADPAGGVTVRLEGIFPFGAADFPGDPAQPRPEFTTAEAAGFYDLAGRCAQTVRLDGVYGLPGDEQWDPARNHAYRQVRDMILQNSDLLVAVFDPAAAAREAGTLETIRQAVTAGVPVLAVLLTADAPCAAVYRVPADLPDADRFAAPPMSDASWRDSLRQTLDYLLTFPHATPTGGEDDRRLAQRQHAYGEFVEQLDVFLHRPAPPGGRSRSFHSTLFAAGWRFVCWLGSCFGRPHGFARYHMAIPAARPCILTVPPYKQVYERADALSQLYMQVYRGAFALAFLLAGVATSTAVTMMVVAYFTSNKPSMWFILVLGCLKIGILLFLLWLERIAQRYRWQERAAEYRYLAELMRPMEWLAPLGSAPPTVEMPAQYASLDPRQSWMPWLFRAVARGALSVCPTEAINLAAARPETIEFSTATANQALTDARDTWLGGQRAYHGRAAQVNHAIENGLESVARLLLRTVLASAGAAFVLELVHHALGERLPPLPEKVIQHLIVVLTALAAALPAFIAALGAIIFQSEAKRLELRSEAMFHGLGTEQEKLTGILDTLQKKPPVHGGAARDAAQALRTIAGVVIAETGDWKALYQTQEIKAG